MRQFAFQIIHIDANVSKIPKSDQCQLAFMVLLVCIFQGLELHVGNATKVYIYIYINFPLCIYPLGIYLGFYLFMAMCFWEATFGYKSYHLSDCYRLYISCKTIYEKPWIIKPIFLTGISCISVAKLKLKHPLLYPTDMKPLEAYLLQLMTVIVATMPSGSNGSIPRWRTQPVLQQCLCWNPPLWNVFSI